MSLFVSLIVVSFCKTMIIVKIVFIINGGNYLALIGALLFTHSNTNFHEKLSHT